MSGLLVRSRARTRVPRLPAHGDPAHGVNRYATAIAAAVHALADAPADERAHVHFTDRLWGAGPADAAAAFERFAARRPVTVTLHDVPQPSDGPRNLERRAAAYRRVVNAARAVACNSRHEAALLCEHVAATADPVVIDHAVDPHPPVSTRPVPDGAIALLGFVYPGKGHREVIDAAARIGGVPVVALGRASAGHERDVAELAARADRLGVPFDVTGFLDDAALLERCRRATVPIAAHRHVSASGSLATWIGAGRRPLAPDSRYTREVAALRPGTITPYPPEAMAAAIEHALRHPGSTWIDDGVPLAPDVPDVARAYLRWWDGGVAW